MNNSFVFSISIRRLVYSGPILRQNWSRQMYLLELTRRQQSVVLTSPGVRPRTFQKFHDPSYKLEICSYIHMALSVSFRKIEKNHHEILMKFTKFIQKYEFTRSSIYANWIYAGTTQTKTTSIKTRCNVTLQTDTNNMKFPLAFLQVLTGFVGLGGEQITSRRRN